MKTKIEKSYFPVGVFTKVIGWGLVKVKFAHLNHQFNKQNKGKDDV